MRVLVVTNMYPSPASSSAGIFVRREVEALQRFHPEVTLEVAHVDTVGHRSRYLTGIATTAAVAQRFRPDIVHVHYGLSVVMAAAVRRPLVCTFHGSDLNIGWQRRVAHAFRRSIDRGIVVSPSLCRHVPAGVRTTVIPCGVDTGLLPTASKGEARAALGIDDSEVLVGFPGSPRKTIKRYDRFEGVVELIAGVHPVVFEGMRHDEALLWLAALDCLVMTSDAEGSPVITKEALCMGCRVVSTAVGDMREQVAGLSGCRIAAGTDPHVIAAAVRAALGEDPPSRSLSRDRFDLRREADAVAAIYRELMA